MQLVLLIQNLESSLVNLAITGFGSLKQDKNREGKRLCGKLVFELPKWLYKAWRKRKPSKSWWLSRGCRKRFPELPRSIFFSLALFFLFLHTYVVLLDQLLFPITPACILGKSIYWDRLLVTQLGRTNYVIVLLLSPLSPLVSHVLFSFFSTIVLLLLDQLC